MKNTMSTLGIITVITLFLAFTSSSCGKKETEDIHDLSVTMSYLPNPALKDSLITLTFLVKDGHSATNVTNYTCSSKLSTSTTSNPITLTQGTTGTYSGTCTFSSVGMYTISMGYMHGDENMSHSFSVNVQ